MTEQEFLQIPISGILPQRKPFIMVSQLKHYDEVVTITRFHIEADNLFCQDGEFVASGIIENIAQTCAARIGYINKYILHRDINIGFIGAIRKLDILQLPHMGDTLETRIEVISSSFGLTLAHGEVRLEDGTLVAQGEMKIALSEKISN